MSSIITHVAFGAAIGAVGGAALGRKRRVMAAAGALFAAMPDADVIGFPLGVAYESFFGHRGFFHSPFFALCVGILVALLVWRDEGRRVALIMGITAFAAMTSHAILDALTTGGAGVMMFFPFDTQRFFFDWRPIAVSPIGIRPFFSAWGARVILSELPWLAAAAAIGLAASKTSFSAAVARKKISD